MIEQTVQVMEAGRYAEVHKPLPVLEKLLKIFDISVEVAARL